MRLLTILLTTFLSTSALADEQADVEAFFAAHTAADFNVYCRDGVNVPECRTLITFKSNETGKIVDAFQISFSAPARPFAATELYIPVTEDSCSQVTKYRNYVDNTMDGKFKVASSEEYEVSKIKWETTITGLAFGSISFQKQKAIVTLNNGNQIEYSRLK